MVIASTLGDFLWSLLVIFFMIVYFMMLFHVIVDVIRRGDVGGGKKAAWLIFLLVLPLIGLLSYVIVNGDAMNKRDVQASRQAQQDFDSYVRQTAGGAASEIAHAKQLLDEGTITQQEFEQIKAKALAAA